MLVGYHKLVMLWTRCFVVDKMLCGVQDVMLWTCCHLGDKIKRQGDKVSGQVIRTRYQDKISVQDVMTRCQESILGQDVSTKNVMA